MREIGEGYEQGELYLPDMIGAADTMQASMPVLKEAFKKSEQARESLGTALIGSVAGDIHTIGKSMVIAMLIAEGFDVVDMGIDIPTAKFVEAVKEHKPVLLAMSALLSTTAPEAGKVVEALKAEGLRDKVKIIVGGGAVTDAFAKEIGADGYEDTAPEGAALARQLVTQ
jgi:methanogenic corrinoid protein MtbC1